jgi:hypothetical protein
VSEAVASGEVVVDDEHVRATAVELQRELGCGWCRSHDRQVGLGVEEPPEPCEHGGMVVEKGHVEHWHAVWSRRPALSMGS